ncbi:MULTISPECIES: TetR/AcrR family transcriptional regulator [unclassified Butyrivibrio]|uniref:TetR/AcrR family transcriptional regulator n=1 Tax=unclassified Butyrivibrio TaxID=2639466 RepID=UPI0003B5A3BA|nr:MULTISPECIES: TetR/AcrR family transcriptional regulator [unclassified Butyrivibrio]SDB41215.1 transcriptional regulator, TetR family [Butyrivibrio sp. INlla16]SEM40801.1 transcriptional regulator, TetR family [Butyrivibrio sp. ob235]
MNDTKIKILEAVLSEFKKKGSKFTMDDVASDLHMSKKTIYKEFDDKEKIFDSLVDYCFDNIKEKEAEVLADKSLSTIEQIEKIMICMPDKYRDVDFRMVFTLKEKYPKIYVKVQNRLENDWEDTIMLIEKGIREGVIRPLPIPVIKAMTEASIERFLSSNVLIEGNTSYDDALKVMIDIIMRGICVR